MEVIKKPFHRPPSLLKKGKQPKSALQDISTLGNIQSYLLFHSSETKIHYPTKYFPFALEDSYTPDMHFAVEESSRGVFCYRQAFRSENIGSSLYWKV